MKHLRSQRLSSVICSVIAVLALAGCGQPARVPLTNVRGAAQAPVLIEEWGDYQCPSCGSFARLDPQLEAAVISNGNAQFAFHNLAFLGQESVWAAEAAECASDQGRFWDYHKLLYASQDGENRGAFAPARLKALAGQLTLDQTTFNQCLDSGKYLNAVQAETKSGEQLGVNSTPTIFVNGKKLTLSGSRSPIDTIQIAVAQGAKSAQ
jgi:protein-disulfide isomerase